MLAKFFRFDELGTIFRREFLAGLTTFATMGWSWHDVGFRCVHFL
jgi:xanthine/uracil/vitamin C permease (AzgA family)